MADPPSIELRTPAGGAVAVEVLPDELTRLDPARPGHGLWRLRGSLPAAAVDSVRVLCGRLGDGRVIAVAALRPAGAAGHGDEIVAGLLGHASDLGPLTEVLLSTEYGPGDAPRRIGLELYESDAAVPLRVAGTAIGPPAPAANGDRLRVGLELRHGGETGAAIYDLLAAR